MPPPLINDYKKTFVLKRLLETFLGGPRLFSPPTFIIIQVFIFLIPASIVLLVNLNKATDLDTYITLDIVTGCSLFLVDLCIVLIISVVGKRRGNNYSRQIAPSTARTSNSDAVDVDGNNENDTGESESGRRNTGDGDYPTITLNDEEQIVNEGCCHPQTSRFLSPNVSLNNCILPIVALSSSVFGLCTPLMISEITSPVLRGFTIFALCNVRYSAVINSPAELANFGASDRRQPLHRIFYAGLIGGCYAIFTLVYSFEDDGDFEYFVISTFSTLLALLPLMFSLGILPPLDALFLWVLETALILLSGTSPSYYYTGTLISLIVVVLCPILVFVITQESLLIILIECICGYIISCDTGRILSLKAGLCEETPTKSFLRRLFFPSLYILTSLLLILITWLNLSQVSTFSYELSFAIVTLTISLGSWAFRFFSTKRNPSISSKLLLIPIHISHGLLTFLLQIWLTLSIEHEKSEWSSLRISVQHSLGRLVPYLLTIRAFALILNEPRKSSVDFCIAFSIRQYLPIDEARSSSILILFITSLITARVRRFSKNFKTICSIIYAFAVSSLLEPNKIFYTVIAIALSPLSLFSLLLTTLIEGTNLIGVFTLPIFVLGFPRPSTFWKERWLLKKSSRRSRARARSRSSHIMTEDNETLDWKIYSEIGPLLACALARKVHSAKLRLSRGNCFLARYEDRILFIRILSSGWNYAYFQIKGLEMQEQTSCHHQEAAKIDELFEETLTTNATCRNILHFFSLLTLSPLCTLKLPTYSESKSKLSPLSSSHDKAVFRDMFYRAFSYLWIKSNPALKGESYQKELATTATATRSTNANNNTLRKASTSTYKVRDEISNPNPGNPCRTGTDITPIAISSQEFSLTNALFKSTKPTVSFLTMDSLESKPTVVRSESQDHDKNNTDVLEEDEVEEPQPPPPPLFSRQSTRSRSTLTDMTENHNHNHQIDEIDIPTSSDRETDRLSTVWVKHCVGDVIPSNAVKARVEKICKSVWDTVIGIDQDSDKEIDLLEFFSEDFPSKLKILSNSTSTSRRMDMEQITLKAFRYATKLALDEIYSSTGLGVGSPSPSKFHRDSETEEEIFTQLSLFERDYKFCPWGEIPLWINQNANHIITIGKSTSELGLGGENKDSVMRILHYETEGVLFNIGQLDQSTVEAIWGNLNLEMFYMTSDDDERFSIQNDRVLLRNIITQCAKPPLGYPVYDAVFRVNLHKFSVTQTE